DSTELLAWLASQRRHVLGILDGLDDEALRRPVLPTGWSCVAMVRHLTLDVEQFWFRGVVAGEPLDLDGPPDAAWQVRLDEPAADVIDAYRRETELADAIVRARPLDAEPAWFPDDFPVRYPTLRDVLLHVIVETACHAGHLDAARELIDRRTWLILT